MVRWTNKPLSNRWWIRGSDWVKDPYSILLKPDGGYWVVDFNADSIEYAGPFDTLDAAKAAYILLLAGR